MRQKIYLVIFSFVTMGIIDFAAGGFEHFVIEELTAFQHLDIRSVDQ